MRNFLCPKTRFYFAHSLYIYYILIYIKYIKINGQSGQRYCLVQIINSIILSPRLKSTCHGYLLTFPLSVFVLKSERKAGGKQAESSFLNHSSAVGKLIPVFIKIKSGKKTQVFINKGRELFPALSIVFYFVPKSLSPASPSPGMMYACSLSFSSSAAV